MSPFSQGLTCSNSLQCVGVAGPILGPKRVCFSSVHHWSFLCEHPSHCILQHRLSSASHRCCHSVQQQRSPFSWTHVVDARPRGVAYPWQHQPSDGLGCYARSVLLQRPRGGVYNLAPIIVMISLVKAILSQRLKITFFSHKVGYWLYLQGSKL